MSWVVALLIAAAVLALLGVVISALKWLLILATLAVLVGLGYQALTKARSPGRTR